MRFLWSIWRACRPRAIRRGIRNLIFWIPIIWHDVDFDYGPLLDMMRASLGKLEPWIRDGYSMGGEKDADKIRVCLLLLDRIIADEYTIEQGRRNQRSEDTRYLLELMGKHMLGWWD